VWDTIASVQTDTILGCVMVGMAVLGGIVSVYAPTKIRYKIAWVLVFMALGCLACVLVIQQSKQSARSETELQAQIKTVASHTAETSRLQQLNNELQQRVLELGKINAALGRQNISTATGGDSFCWMEFLLIEAGRGVPAFSHSGRYPLYHVEAQIIDQTRKINEPVTLSQAASMGIRISLGDLAPGRSFFLPNQSIPFSDAHSQNFAIVFDARNGTWQEDLRLRNVEGHWSSAIRVRLESARKGWMSTRPVFEQIAKDFPRNRHGLVDWYK
jgi:ABC-type multidrug transport system fused ATPase/permease subunit